jgi:5-methylcytosine-specific restriction endonuclease McrA
MTNPAEVLSSVSDEDLLRRLGKMVRDSRRIEADLVAHVAEVDARRLYASEACPSMYAYCTERLGLSEPEAYLRISAARASREHPVLLTMLADGRLHLSGIALLARHLTPENRDAVLARAAGRSKRGVEELIAEISPRPDAPTIIRRLPAPTRDEPSGGGSRQSSGLHPRSLVALSDETPGRIAPAAGSPASAVELPAAAVRLRPDAVDDRALKEDAAAGTGPDVDADRGAPVAAAGRRERTVVEPLSPGRYRVQFTASAELRDKLERLQTLLRGAVPDGDLAAVIELAVDEKLRKVEARRSGRTIRPRGGARRNRPVDADAAADGSQSDGSASASVSNGVPAAAKAVAAGTMRTARHIPATIRRAVRERDGDQCAYRDGQGRRCSARVRLEFHHRHPFGYGGGHSVDNVCLMCRTHNRHEAAADFGRAAAALRRERARRSAPAVAG